MNVTPCPRQRLVTDRLPWTHNISQHKTCSHIPEIGTVSRIDDISYDLDI